MNALINLTLEQLLPWGMKTKYSFDNQSNLKDIDAYALKTKRQMSLFSASNLQHKHNIKYLSRAMHQYLLQLIGLQLD